MCSIDFEKITTAAELNICFLILELQSVYSDSLIIISHKSVYNNVLLAFCVQHSINNQ